MIMAWSKIEPQGLTMQAPAGSQTAALAVGVSVCQPVTAHTALWLRCGDASSATLDLFSRPASSAMQINNEGTYMDDATSFDPDLQRSSPTANVQLSSGTHRIDIEFVQYGQSGAYYRVTYRDKLLIEKTKEPLFNACRALVAMRLKGRLEMWAGEPHPRMIVRDIEQGAKLTVVEGAKTSPRITRWNPHPHAADDDDTR